MQALLGKITQITPKQAPGDDRLAAFEVRFQPACVLPQRSAVPEWLKDQSLTIERRVLDGRELGHPGDSLVLTAAESVRWLAPLTVDPAIASGALPETLRLRLRWWKEEKPPEFTLRVNGRSRTGSFAKEGDGFSASVETGGLFDFPPRLPVTFEVTCDKLKAGCAVLPQEAPYAARLLLPEGERHRLESDWYVIDITAASHAGGIAALREKGRGVDHFRRPDNRIQNTLGAAGHIDNLKTGWQWTEKLSESALSCTGVRHEGEATRLDLEGTVDEGENLRSSVAYTLSDRLPLLLLERVYRYQKGKKEDDGKEKAAKPKEPIDAMRAVSLGFRAAWMPERDGATGSRVLCLDGSRLSVTRCARPGEGTHARDWAISGGWALAEHPRRREAMLYLFDRERAPHLSTWLGAEKITLEPYWPFVPVRPEESLGYTLALSAGELWGASTEGAWIACRATRPGGGIRCAAIGRLQISASESGAKTYPQINADEPRKSLSNLRQSAKSADESLSQIRNPRSSVARFDLGGTTREAPLAELFVPGVGSVCYATAEFPEGGLEAPFEVEFAGIPARRER